MGARRTTTGGKRTAKAAGAPSRSPSLKAFSYDTPIEPEDLRFTLDITGTEAMGKSHVGATFPGDIAWIETPEEWGKTDPLINKFKYVYKDPKKIYLKRVKTFDDIRQTVASAGADPEVSTIIIDSGTEIRRLAAEEWMREENRKAVFPTTEWQWPNQKIENLIHDIKETGKYIVVTNRKKDEWIGDNTTGRLIRDGYKWITYDFHVVLDLQWGLRGGTQGSGKLELKDYKFAKVKKNGFWGVDEDTNLNYGKPYLFNVTFNGIVEELLKPWGPHPVSETFDKCVEEAKKWVTSTKK